MKLKLRTVILAVVGVMLIFSTPLLANTEEKPVEFQNRDIELAVKQEIGKATGEIYPSDLKSITRLSIAYEQMPTIPWIKFCRNLKFARLYDNHIRDISSFSNLANLVSLDLSDNNISDLSPLSELYELHILDLRNNNITNIQPLIDNFKVKENGEKIGLGEGDQVSIAENKLDLSEGSEDLQDIQTLLDRGVKVEYKNKQ